MDFSECILPDEPHDEPLSLMDLNVAADLIEKYVTEVVEDNDDEDNREVARDCRALARRLRAEAAIPGQPTR